MTDQHTQYDKRFNRPLWNHIERLIEQHCYGTLTMDDAERAARLAPERSAQLLTGITDAAKGLLELPGHEHAMRRLIAITLNEDVPPGTIQAIDLFLAQFRRNPDFARTLQAITALNQAIQTARTATDIAAGIHGEQGWLAYEICRAADYLLTAARATLKHDPAYMTDKLQTGIRYMQSADRHAAAWSAGYRPHLRPVPEQGGETDQGS